jgi:hypothetical protein
LVTSALASDQMAELIRKAIESRFDMGKYASQVAEQRDDMT